MDEIKLGHAPAGRLPYASREVPNFGARAIMTDDHYVQVTIDCGNHSEFWMKVWISYEELEKLGLQFGPRK